MKESHVFPEIKGINEVSSNGGNERPARGKSEGEIRLGNSENGTKRRGKGGLAIDEVVNMRAIGSFAIMWIVFLWVSVRMSGINCYASTEKVWKG